jgi:Protein of unknown function (DUF1566)/CARDB
VSAGRPVALLSALLLGAAAPPLAQPPALESATAKVPDLEIVALQTTGPGRAGDCNAVVARVHNAGSAATAGPPVVRLDVTGTALWTRTTRAATPLQPGDTVEVWFQGVPLEGGRLSQLEATADPDGHEHESSEVNNARRVPRDPQLACGAPDPPPATGLELRVVVVGRAVAPAAEPPPIESAEVTVTSPLGVGVVLASAITATDGRASLTIPADARAPVLKVTARAPGCPPAVRLATPSAGAGTPLEVTVELDCAAGAAAPVAVERGVLEIECALPGLLRVDDEPAQTVSFGSRITVRRPGATVRLRAASANGTVFHDTTIEVPRDDRRAVVVDAPALQRWPPSPAEPEARDRPRDHASEDGKARDPASGEAAAGAIVEDLRSGLLWTVGAPTTASFAQAAEVCDGLARGGDADWRLPEIDELAFVLEASARQGAGPGTDTRLDDLPSCCVWSATEHTGLRLTFYRDGGHLYGRRAEEGGLAALCVRGTAYSVDPLAVPERYHDRLPGRRSFRPRD